MRGNNVISFGEHVRKLRICSNLSILQLAKIIKVDPSLLGKIERNERPPSRKLITDIAQVFGIDKNELLNEFISDVIAYRILHEQADITSLKLAEEKVRYILENNK